MRFRAAVVVTAVVLGTAIEAAEHPSLAKARAMYNAADYDGAIGAATVARNDPASADAAALVMGRSYLERFRLRADPADLASARDALGTVRASALTPRDQLDLLVGLGQSLYLGDVFGAAAEVFDTALSRASILDATDRLQLVDWWATALDKEAQRRPGESRSTVYARVMDRMEEELRTDPASAPANYWLAAAARGVGDLDRAWQAAVAGWVRASLTPESAPKLRADLDRLMTEALIPERARTRPTREQQEAIATLRGEWDSIKSQWK